MYIRVTVHSVNVFRALVDYVSSAAAAGATPVSNATYQRFSPAVFRSVHLSAISFC